MSRKTKRDSIKRIKRVLASGQVAQKGFVAFGNTADGLLYATPGGTTFIPIGYFEKDTTGDGVIAVTVDLFQELFGDWLKNDTAPNDVQDSDFLAEVYSKDGQTVSTSDGSGTRSKGGRVLAVDARFGVFVQSGIAVTGPTGASSDASQETGVATRTALAALAAASRFDGMLVMVRSDGSLWRFVAASVLTSDEAKELVVAPSAGTGAWIRADKAFTMKLPIAFGTVDAAALFTCPAGYAVRMTGLPYWDITTGFSGGSASAIGVSSDQTDTTKGDLLGGAAGDVAATLVAGVIPGTLGGKNDTLAHIQAFVLKATKKFRFDRITDAFTAGAGFVCIPVSIEQVG